MATFQTDSLNPSAIPSSTLGRRRAPPTSSSSTLTGFDDPSTAKPSDPDKAARDKFHDEWNVRIDRDIKSLAGGLRELVDLADIGSNPSAHSSTPTSLHLRIRTAQLIRSAQSLRDMSHELRLMLLLSDEVDLARRRDAEVKNVREELGVRRGRVERDIRSLLTGERPPVDGVRETGQETSAVDEPGETSQSEEKGNIGDGGNDAPEQPTLDPLEEEMETVETPRAPEAAHAASQTERPGGIAEGEDEDEDDFEEV